MVNQRKNLLELCEMCPGNLLEISLAGFV